MLQDTKLYELEAQEHAYLLSLNKRWLEEDIRLAEECPVLHNVIVHPSNPNNYRSLKRLLKQKLSKSNMELALKQIIPITFNSSERFGYACMLYESNINKETLAILGNAYYDVGLYPLAYSALARSKPYSYVYLYKCYENGICVPKNINLAYKLLLEAARYGDTLALNEMNQFIIRNNECFDDYSKANYPEDINLTTDERYKLFMAARRKLYLTSGDLEYIVKTPSKLKLSLAKSYAKKLEATIYETKSSLSIRRPLNVLHGLLKLIDEANAIHPSFIKDYKLSLELVEFVISYEKRRSKPSSGEAALYLGISRDEACESLALLDVFIKNRSNVKLLIDLTYMLEDYKLNKDYHKLVRSTDLLFERYGGAYE